MEIQQQTQFLLYKSENGKIKLDENMVCANFAHTTKYDALKIKCRQQI